jgi:hypothetical protein
MQIDELIAKDFLGLDVQTNARGLSTIGEPDYYDIAGDMQLQNPVPMYSEDIAAAWPLLTKLRDLGWAWRLDSNKNGATVVITIQNLKRETFVIESDTAPKAICEACLKVANRKNVVDLKAVKKDIPDVPS